MSIYESIDDIEPVTKKARPAEQLSRTPSVIDSDAQVIVTFLKDLLNLVEEKEDEEEAPVATKPINLADALDFDSEEEDQSDQEEEAGFDALEYMNRNFHVPGSRIERFTAQDDSDDSDDSESDAIQEKILEQYTQGIINKQNFKAGKHTAFLRKTLKKRLGISDMKLVHECTSKDGLQRVIEEAGLNCIGDGHPYQAFRFATLPDEVRRAVCEVFDDPSKSRKTDHIPSSNGIGDKFATHCANKWPAQILEFAEKIKEYKVKLQTGEQTYSQNDFLVYIGLKTDRPPTPRAIKKLPEEALALVAKNPSNDAILKDDVKFVFFDEVLDMVSFASHRNLDANTCMPLRTSSQLHGIYILPLEPKYGRAAVFQDYREFVTFLKTRGYIP